MTRRVVAEFNVPDDMTNEDVALDLDFRMAYVNGPTDRDATVWASAKDYLADLTSDHMDSAPTYEDGMFVVTCLCGERFVGLDPDDAAAKAMRHANGEDES